MSKEKQHNDAGGGRGYVQKGVVKHLFAPPPLEILSLIFFTALQYFSTTMEFCTVFTYIVTFGAISYFVSRVCI